MELLDAYPAGPTMGPETLLELLLTDFFSVQVSSSKYDFRWVPVAIIFATRKCRYSKVSNVEHGGLCSGMLGPLLVNMMLADTSGIAYREAHCISLLPVCPVKPCHEMMQGTAEAVCFDTPSGMLCSTESGAPIQLRHTLKRTYSRVALLPALQGSPD